MLEQFIAAEKIVFNALGTGALRQDDRRDVAILNDVGSPQQSGCSDS